MTARIAAACCVLLTFLTTAQAQLESVYTKLDVNDCLILSTEEEVDENQGAEWVCAGHNRIVVWIAEGDLRYFLGYGSRGRDQCSYRQTLGPFHTVHTTLEWRLKSSGGQSRPIATILRYFFDWDGKKLEYLVVTKLGDGQACHMAYVDAADPNANRLAHDAVDRFASGFDCERDRPFYYSAQGPRADGPLGTSLCSD